MINGVPGMFIVDTGASFVSLSKEFAERAKLPLSGDYSIRMQTANGIAMAQRSSVSKVQIGRVSARRRCCGCSRPHRQDARRRH